MDITNQMPPELRQQQQLLAQQETTSPNTDAPQLAPQFAPVQDPAEQIITEKEQGSIETQPIQEIKETSTARNFRALREKSERLERDNAEYQRVFREMLAQQALHKPSVPVSQPILEEDEDAGVADDALVEGKVVNKAVKRLSKALRQQQQELASYKKQSADILVESRVKAQYPDFDRVVTKDNIELLKMERPDLTYVLNNQTDAYSAAILVYDYIKTLNLNESTGATSNYDQDKALVKKNMAKPRPMASLSPQQGDTPLSNANAFANGLTDELKKSIWKEMQEIKKRA